jgi:tetratricopeptide (TPR) repeat protein
MATELVTALRRESGYDLRAEVLALATRRDQKLGEEFLKKLTQDRKDERDDSGYQDSSDSSETLSKRLNLATRLLDEGDIGRAVEFAAPALNQVNASSIGFLSRLREKRSEAADQRFALLLAQAELDPSSDANTVSGLSSYAFTPGFYVTFNKDGSARWTQPEQSTAALKPPKLPAPILNKFFQIAATILLRPLPPPNQDFTTSGRIGKSMVVKRLLPLFEQHAPDTAVALRTQLQALNAGSRSELNDESPLLKQGFQTDATGSSVLETMEERIGHAKSSRERDLIYADAAVTLASRGDSRAQEFAQKIEDSDRRVQVLRYVDLELVRFALLQKKSSEAIRLAASDHISHAQRAWAFMQAARLLMDSGRQSAIELLEKAANEARRIDAEDPDRARLLIGVASQFLPVDRIRGWEIMGEVVKAANNSERFSGENVELHFPFATKSGLRITSVGGADFGLSGALRSLAKDDLYRSIDLAKAFKNEAPRAIALLAVASSLLEKVDTPR